MLPTQLGNLTALQVLNLNSNSFGGTIPSEIGRLKNLSAISLSCNDLTVPPPPTPHPHPLCVLSRLARSVGCS